MRAKHHRPSAVRSHASRPHALTVLFGRQLAGLVGKLGLAGFHIVGGGQGGNPAVRGRHYDLSRVFFSKVADGVNAGNVRFVEWIDFDQPTIRLDAEFLEPIALGIGDPADRDQYLIERDAQLLAAQTWPETSAAEWPAGRTTQELYDEAKGWLSPLNKRRWRNFKRNKRAYWSLWIFSVLFGLSLFSLARIEFGSDSRLDLHRGDTLERPANLR